WIIFFFFSSRRRHTRFSRDWSSDVCSSDLAFELQAGVPGRLHWPLPSELRAVEPRPARAPWTASEREDEEPEPVSDERVAAARRSEERRVGKRVGLGRRRFSKKKSLRSSTT